MSLHFHNFLWIPNVGSKIFLGQHKGYADLMILSLTSLLFMKKTFIFPYFSFGICLFLHLYFLDWLIMSLFRPFSSQLASAHVSIIWCQPSVQIHSEFFQKKFQGAHWQEMTEFSFNKPDISPIFILLLYKLWGCYL